MLLNLFSRVKSTSNNEYLASDQVFIDIYLALANFNQQFRHPAMASVLTGSFVP